jgi:hypothetical protein
MTISLRAHMVAVLCAVLFTLFMSSTIAHAQNIPYTITVSGEGSGSVREGESVLCPQRGITTCTHEAGARTAVTLIAVADTGSVFAGWSGACTGTATSCTFTIDGSDSVEARFDTMTVVTTPLPPGEVEIVSEEQQPGLYTFNLNVSVTEVGTGQGKIRFPSGKTCGPNTPPSSCSFTVQSNAGPFLISAEALPGYYLAGWTGACKGSQEKNEAGKPVCPIHLKNTTFAGAQFEKIVSVQTTTTPEDTRPVVVSETPSVSTVPPAISHFTATTSTNSSTQEPPHTQGTSTDVTFVTSQILGEVSFPEGTYATTTENGFVVTYPATVSVLGIFSLPFTATVHKENNGASYVDRPWWTGFFSRNDTHIDDVLAGFGSAGMDMESLNLFVFINAQKEAADDIKNALGEMEDLGLHMKMDRQSKMMSTLSNLLQNFASTTAGIVSNLK